MAEQVTFRVSDDLDGERLDKVLADHFAIARSSARDLVGQGVLVDGAKASPSDRLDKGQEVQSPRPETTDGLVPEPVTFAVLLEDDQVIVVDKPAGLVVHPGAGNRKGTLAAGLVHRYPELGNVGPPQRAGLVHRLDKDTSGTLLVARTPASYQSLVGALRRRQIERVYLALVEGSMPAATGTIDAPIGGDPARPTRRAVVHGGKPARTHYQVLEEVAGERFTLLEVTLETGRTHQIRVHLAAISHPVVGDRVYGTGRSEAPRTFLHAARLGFQHPGTGDRITVASPLPEDLARALDRMR
ncbi:MAG: RluA family pseudouridine synthase [Acidimicrobiia bacterium]